MVELYNLYFQDKYGKVSEIASNVEKEALHPLIVKWIEKKNPNFKVYYTRSWEDDDDVITFDVGSWSEFFKAYKV